MKDEIKEILDRLKIKSDRYNHHLKYNMSYENKDEDYKAYLLLDYITNLQDENKVLLEKYSTIQILYNSSKLKNDKAIKYIKEHIRIDDEYPAYMEMLVEEKNELLNILQGGDK